MVKHFKKFRNFFYFHETKNIILITHRPGLQEWNSKWFYVKESRNGKEGGAFLLERWNYGIIESYVAQSE